MESNPTPADMMNNFDQLEQAVTAAAFHYLGDFMLPDCPETHRLPPEFIESFGRNYALRIANTMQKFAEGQRKYGGLITDRDLIYELGQELRDAEMYHLFLTMKTYAHTPTTI